jgi:ferredoxin-thioredoxin reductase catalytic subunit
MSDAPQVTRETVDRLYAVLDRDAKSGGYHLNPDVGFTRELVEGLLVNEQRYGYQACPCRLATGVKEKDLDIICPCDYRDPDVVEHGACYCALYVSQEIADGKKKATRVPERRKPRADAAGKAQPQGVAAVGAWKPALPVWRCKVCGYLCAREAPPEVCPICKVKKERFERFI